MIDFKTLIDNLRMVFPSNVRLPIAVWYSNEPAGELVNVPHCIFGALPQMNSGETVTFSEQTIKCGGGKTYCGFRPLNPNIPKFVSGKERYKQTPEMVSEYVENLGLKIPQPRYLNFVRIDNLPEHTAIEGIFFIDVPDVISGLSSWAYFDSNSNDAVQALFGSGCTSLVALIEAENRRHGRSCFLGMMDLSVRKFLAPNELSFAIPYSRLEEMAETLSECALMQESSWSVLKERIARSACNCSQDADE